MEDIKELNNDDLKEVTGGRDYSYQRDDIKLEKYDRLYSGSEHFYTNLPELTGESEVVYVPYRMAFGDVVEYGKPRVEFCGGEVLFSISLSESDDYQLEKEAFIQKYPYLITGEFRRHY